MISITEQTKQNIRDSITAAFASASAAGELSGEPSGFTVEVPADTSKGDFATNAAMVNARAFRSAPVKIANLLVKYLDKEALGVSKIEIAGPGFINFFMKPEWFASIIEEISEKKEQFGHSDYGAGKKVMVEYVSANPTGPMHMGNARGGAIGDVLAEAFAWSGHDTCREFYVNDAGNQIAKFGMSLSVRYQQIFKGEDAVPLPEEAYHGDDIKEHAQKFADINGDKYLDCDEETRRNALIAYALPLNIEKLHTDLGRYRIQYDNWFHESTLHESGAVMAACQKLKESGWAYEQDGALWYKNIEMMKHLAEKAGKPLSDAEIAELKDDVLIRANGFPTYFAADIAYHYNKFVTRGFDKVINIWGADHHGHVARLKGAMEAMGVDSSKLDIVLMQLVRLMKDGKPYRMSKRSGKAVSLSDLLDEVPMDAARFFFIMREPGSTLDFDLDLAVQETSQNPVFYVQYAHARICSLLKNLAAEGISPRAVTTGELAALSTSEERELIRRLGQFPGEIIAAARDYDPAKISSYCTDIATLFHKFYTACRVKGEEDSVLQARLAIAMAAKTVLHNALALLKVEAPEVM